MNAVAHGLLRLGRCFLVVGELGSFCSLASVGAWVRFAEWRRLGGQRGECCRAWVASFGVVAFLVGSENWVRFAVRRLLVLGFVSQNGFGRVDVRLAWLLSCGSENWVRFAVWRLLGIGFVSQ